MHRHSLTSYSGLVRLRSIIGDAQANNLALNHTSNIMDLYAEKYGMGIVLAGGNAGIGRWDFNTNRA